MAAPSDGDSDHAHETTSDGGPGAARRLLAVIAGAVVLLVGIGVGALVWVPGPKQVPQAGGPVESAVVGVATAEDDPALTADRPATPEAQDVVSSSGPANTPREAVEQFLAAEAHGNLQRSYELLSTSSQESVGSSVEGWVAAHANMLPPITGHEIDSSGADKLAQVTAVVEFEPGLNEVTGLVPGRARVTWETVAEAGAWRVDLEHSAMEPLYPQDTFAPNAVRAWAQARQDCEPTREWEGTPLGSPALAQNLCGTDGDVQVGEATGLGQIDATEFTSAFGPEVSDWARVVGVTAPVHLRAVVAPLGQDWIVIGVLAGTSR